MRARLTSIVIALTVLAVMPALARAATLTVDRDCYADASQRQDLVSYSGAGFVAGDPFNVLLDKAPLAGAGGTIGPAGDLSGSFIAPSLSKTKLHEHTFKLAVADGTSTTTTSFKVAKLFAGFDATKGPAQSMKAVFHLYGFGLDGTPNPPIYVHYLNPHGKYVATRYLGYGHGACGSRPKTARRPLFGFKASRGLWNLQFDTSKKFHRGKAGKDFLFYTVPVSVKRG